jgi:hypothetical protein
MIINNLFHKLRTILQKRTGPRSAVVPFALGRVYQTYYRNWHTDPRPLLWILGSDTFYTVGINIHYLGMYQHALMHFIMLMRDSKMVLTGLSLYQTLKMRQPSIPKTAFRKYFTSMLRGKLVSEGVSTLPEPNKANFFVDPWVRRLNNLIRPKIFSFNKVNFMPHETEEIRSQITQVQYNRDKSKPFANRTMNTPTQPTPPNQPGGTI